MIGSLRRFWKNYSAKAVLLRAEQSRREAAITYVLAHPQEFIGQALNEVISRCGPPDRRTDFDFGRWVAEWNAGRNTRLSVFIFDDICTDIQ